MISTKRQCTVRVSRRLARGRDSLEISHTAGNSPSSPRHAALNSVETPFIQRRLPPAAHGTRRRIKLHQYRDKRSQDKRDSHVFDVFKKARFGDGAGETTVVKEEVRSRTMKLFKLVHLAGWSPGSPANDFPDQHKGRKYSLRPRGQYRWNRTQTISDDKFMDASL